MSETGINNAVGARAVQTAFIRIAQLQMCPNLAVIIIIVISRRTEPAELVLRDGHTQPLFASLGHLRASDMTPK